jgi:phospholipid-translocating ATPase
MSVILMDEDGNYTLYCKGADTIIFDRVKDITDSVIEETQKSLESYAKIGLRTLVLA